MWRVGREFRVANEHTLASAPSHGGLSKDARRCTISPPEPRPTPKMESRAGHQQQQQLRNQCGDRHEPVDNDVSNRTYTATYSTSLTRAPFPADNPRKKLKSQAVGDVRATPTSCRSPPYNNRRAWCIWSATSTDDARIAGR